MFTTDTSRCPLINVNCSRNSACSNDRPECGAYAVQSQPEGHTLLHGKASIGANSICSVYVGGVTIWLVRRCAGALVTRCLHGNKNICRPQISRVTFTDSSRRQ